MATFAPAITPEMLKNALRRPMPGQGAPADFPGMVIPNPNGIKPQADDEPPAATPMPNGTSLRRIPNATGSPTMDTSNPPMNQMVPTGAQPVRATMTPGAPPAGGGMTPSPVQQPKQPTDDPTIAGDLPKPPDMSQYFLPAMQRIQELEAKRAAVPTVDPQQVKPKLWERLVGIALGATQLKNPEMAGQVADQVVHRRLYGAERNRAMALQPIDEQLKNAREDFPVYSQAAEAAQRNFANSMDVAKENRERFTAKSNADYKQQFNEIRDMYDKGRIEDAQNRLDQMQKQLDEKKEHDRDWYEMQGRMLDLRRELQEAREKNKGAGAGPRTIEHQKAVAIDKANRDYRNKVSLLGPHDEAGRKQAKQDLAQDLQNAQDAYEAAIADSGGTPDHYTVDDNGVFQKAQSGGAGGTDIPQPVISPALDQRGKVGDTPVTMHGVTQDQLNKNVIPPKPSPSKPANNQPANKVDSLNGHKNGDVVTLKGVGKVKITQLYSNGSFDYEAAK